MMVRWTPEAAADLETIGDHLFDDRPERATALLRRIYEETGNLTTFPYRGRPGKKAGTRELVVSGLPWIIVYQVLEEAVEIVRILHGAQRWP